MFHSLTYLSAVVLLCIGILSLPAITPVFALATLAETRRVLPWM